jgi:predicted ABC-type ATPase
MGSNVGSRTQNDFVVVGQPGKGHLYIVRGIPGSGKSTYAKELVSMGHAVKHIESDMYFERSGKYVWSAEKLKDARFWCLRTVQTLLNQNGRVVVSNCFLNYKAIKDFARYAKINGHAVTLVTMNTEYSSIHDVPAETIATMKDKFESHESIREKIVNAAQ